jgi:transcription-repair coupling factor (superfamily II helicase)
VAGKREGLGPWLGAEENRTPVEGFTDNTMYQRVQNLVELKRWVENGVKDLRVTGIWAAARVLYITQLLLELDRPCLLILPDAKEANRFYRELEFFLPETLVSTGPGERRLYDFPIYDISPLAGLSPHRDVITRRLQALYVFTSDPNPIVVTSVEAVMLRILPKDAMITALGYMEVGEELDRENLLQRLQVNGYLRTSLVEEMGDYSVRGGVVDIFPPLYSQPIRLEFWGDRIESIRHFDSLSQRSTEHLKDMVLLPANEIIMDRENIRRARSMGRLPNQFQDTLSFPGQEAWVNHFYSHLDTLFDYFPQNGLLALIDPHRIEREGVKFLQRFQRESKRYREEAEERESPFPEMVGLLLSDADLEQRLENYQRIDFSGLTIENQRASAQSLHIKGTWTIDDDLDVRAAGRGRVSMAPLAEKISQWLELGSRVILVCRTEQQGNRLKEILQNYEVHVDESVDRWNQISSGKGLSICLGRLSKGFAWPERGIYVVSEDEIFGSKRARARAPVGMGEERVSLTAFSQMNVGDLVVHQDHGIGQYAGLRKMEIEEKANDFVLVEYAHHDRLYVPADRISILQKYIGADERHPKLDRLGGRSWDLAKEKAKKSVREIAKQLLEIYALRKYRKGYTFSRPDNYFREFEATFEHEETPDQIKAIDEVLSDMESERPMDRLVCGDVGFGKTEVAIRSAFKAVLDGKQVALLVPTTVLAEQHYETFRLRMEPYQVKVSVLSRFKSRSEQKEILAKVRSGKIDVLIGTHRILQKDVSFRELGLLIIDEEQRFGVKQKEILKNYRAMVDVLALTATPIPRTLHMSLMGVRDLSIIETPPEDRLAIQTYLLPYDEATIAHAIESELERAGQVFFVHNRVQTIDDMANALMKLVPQARFAIAHGQMKERELEETMVRFFRKKIDVLVCTTIIESGLDIPSTNTIIINDTDRFGLSQIYQLRGRVGRSKESAYAYLLISDGSRLTREAEKRLKALMDFSHLGAGIHLALHDLKIRGGGNILGFTQSGHISAIGYELYMKLIEQTMAELRGEEWHEEINPEINVDLSAYLPEGFISDIDVRLNLYRRLSSLREEAELEVMIDEMKDRFGSPPEEVSNLMAVMSVRLILKKTGVSKLDVSSESLIFTFSPESHVEPEKVVKLVQRDPHSYQFLSERKLRIKIDEIPRNEAYREVRRSDLPC